MFPVSIRKDGLCLMDREEGFEGDVHSEKTQLQERIGEENMGIVGPYNPLRKLAAKRTEG